MMGYDPFTDDAQSAVQPSNGTSANTECEDATPEPSASNDNIDRYINRAYPTWEIGTPAPEGTRRLTTTCAESESLPNHSVKGGCIKTADWEPYEWIFSNLRWCPVLADDGDGTTYFELAVLFQLVYSRYDGRNNDIELETRLMRAAVQ